MIGREGFASESMGDLYSSLARQLDTIARWWYVRDDECGDATSVYISLTLVFTWDMQGADLMIQKVGILRPLTFVGKGRKEVSKAGTRECVRYEMALCSFSC